MGKEKEGAKKKNTQTKLLKLKLRHRYYGRELPLEQRAVENIWFRL